MFQRYEVVCCGTAFPPAWASVISFTSLTISFMVCSCTFQHCWLGWFLFHWSIFLCGLYLLYVLKILPLRHELGMRFSSCWLFIVLFRVLVVYWFASKKFSFGISPGPWFSFLLIFIVFYVSFMVTDSWPCFLLFACCDAILKVVVISFVQSWNSGFPSLAWKRKSIGPQSH